MLQSFGLSTYSRNTQLKTLALLSGYVFIVLCVSVAISLMFAVVTTPGTITTKIFAAQRLFELEWSRMLAGALLWALLASVQFGKAINASLGGQSIERIDNPRLFNIVENLAILTGLSIPKIHIIETAATNAFMAGLTSSRMSLTVTRGLLNTLDDAQLTAVVAHEFVMVLSGETRKVGLATVLSGVCTYVATLILQPFYKPSFRMLWVLLALPFFPYIVVGVMAVAAIAAIAGGLLLKLSISKLRVLVCDAGSLELTKDPEALKSAIHLMSLNADIDGASPIVRPLLFIGQEGWFSTHPSSEQRITALSKYYQTPETERNLKYPTFQIAKSSWRNMLEVPDWVSNTSCILPVVCFAVFCGFTSKWTSVDRAEILARKKEIQSTYEFAYRQSAPERRATIYRQAQLLEWAYDIDFDFQSLLNSPEVDTGLPQYVRPTTVDVHGMTVEFGSAFVGSYEKHHAHMLTARFKDKARFEREISVAAQECANQFGTSPISQAVGLDWARLFTTASNSATFKHRRFPLDVELRGIKLQLEDESGPLDKFPSSSSEYQDFFQKLRENGFGSTWDLNTCVFGKTRKKLETWVTLPEIYSAKIKPDEISAMEAGLKELDAPPKPLPPLPATTDPNTLGTLLVDRRPSKSEENAMENLRDASWNQGSKPLSLVFLPAMILFVLWRLLKAFVLLVRKRN